MNEFSLGLALLDFVPVVAFGASAVLVGLRFQSPLFILGASLSLLAGILKAVWKLVYTVSGKDLVRMNKCFLPLQLSGWLIMIAAVVIDRTRVNLSALVQNLLSVPQLLFFVLFILCVILLIIFRKTSFSTYSARANWIGEIINSVGMLSLLLGVLFSVSR